MLKKDWRE